MYGRRYVRLLVLVTLLSLFIMMVTMSKDYPLSNLMGSNRATVIKGGRVVRQRTKEAIMSRLESTNAGVDLSKRIDVFPLKEELFAQELYNEHALKTFSDPLPSVKDKPENFEFSTEEICPKLEYRGSVFLAEQKYLNADYESIQKALNANEEFKKVVDEAKAKFQPKIADEKQWFRFAGSSAWLAEYGVHFMVSRIMYSPSGIPNKAFVSFLYAQIFDSNWDEVTDLKLTVPYESIISRHTPNNDGTFTEFIMEKKVEYRDLTYPSLLPIPFDYLMHSENGKYYWGPEDPRILTRKNPLGFEEPLVVFNMKSTAIVKRVMHLFLPFSNRLKMLTKRDEPFAYIEKNWTPFVGGHKESQTDHGISHLNFIYSIDPLEIVSCDIDTAVCHFLQKQHKEDTDYIGPLRGGTQFVQLPFAESIPKHVLDKFNIPENRNVYIGWARAHLDKCGCGESMYRPNMVILVEDYNPETKKFFYKLSVISEYFDFGAKVNPWTVPKIGEDGKLIEDQTTEQCVGRSVLIPNSIAYWEVGAIQRENVYYPRKAFNKIPTDDDIVDRKAEKVMKHEAKAKRDGDSTDIYFHDFMGVTLSSADADVSIVQVRGLLNYILKIPSMFDSSTVVQSQEQFQPNGFGMNYKCAIRASGEYCVRFAEANGGVTKYGEQGNQQ